MGFWNGSCLTSAVYWVEFKHVDRGEFMLIYANFIVWKYEWSKAELKKMPILLLSWVKFNCFVQSWATHGRICFSWQLPLTLLFPSGSTPYGCYQKLIEYYKSGDISFKYVKTFNMDEYVGKMKLSSFLKFCRQVLEMNPTWLWG